MIQIIREGNLKEPVIRFNCLRCKCVFDADKDDYKLILTSDDLAYITDCPHCHKRVARMMITDRRHI
nr:MAG TPA: DNA-directed RNA polymerase II subunit [Bacteriophage sp.]